LTPIYASPMVDNGYDISDYRAIHPEMGSMDDFDELLACAHQKGIKVILDIVVNHTSTEHPWFQSAIQDKNSPYRDYYIWRKGQEGGAPNNWQSKFGGSAWAFDPKSEEYYLHLFAKEQADLNWENPKVRQEVESVLAFWAQKGVDGFRLDVINLISKDQRFLDDDNGDGRKFYTDGPKVHDYLQQISRHIFQKYQTATVGEMSSTSLEHCQRYSSSDGKELSMVFNFHHLKVDYPNGEKWAASEFDFLALKSIFNHWQRGLHDQGWGAIFWCNHDQPRVVSRFGCDGLYREKSAKMLATSLHLMQGTPYIYQGEEIGMTNPGFEQIEQYRDVESLNYYQILRELGKTQAQAMAILKQKSRDNARTPMQWCAGKYAGFSQVAPWIDLAHNADEIHVEGALKRKDSVFYHYKNLIKIRKLLPVVTLGDYQDMALEHPQVHAYQRKTQSQTLIVINNFYQSVCQFELPACWQDQSAVCVISNDAQFQAQNCYQLGKDIKLNPYQSCAFLVNH
ncbi:MAG: alpha,alpha-phosphotrehalase, partial [Vibrio sp.]